MTSPTICKTNQNFTIKKVQTQTQYQKISAKITKPKSYIQQIQSGYSYIVITPTPTKNLEKNNQIKPGKREKDIQELGSTS